MQAIRTRFHGQSNVKGSRYSAKCEARTIYRSSDHALTSDGNHQKVAAELLAMMGWKGAMVGGSFDNDTYWVFTDTLRQIDTIGE
jgi:hypothetical protein